MIRASTLAVAVLGACAPPSLDVTFVMPPGIPEGSLQVSLSIIDQRQGVLTCVDVAFADSNGLRDEIDRLRSGTFKLESGSIEVDRVGRKLLVGEAFVVAVPAVGRIAAGCLEVGDITSPSMKARIIGERAAVISRSDSTLPLGHRDGTWETPFEVEVADLNGNPLAAPLHWQLTLPNLERRSGETNADSSGLASFSPPLGSAPGPFELSVAVAWGGQVTGRGVIEPPTAEAVLELGPGVQVLGAGVFSAGALGSAAVGGAAGIVPVSGSLCDAGSCWLEVTFAGTADAGLEASVGPVTWPPNTALVPSQVTEGRMLLWGTAGAFWWQPLDGTHQQLDAGALTVQRPSGTWVPPCAERAPEVELLTVSGVGRFDLGGRRLASLPITAQTIAAGCMNGTGQKQDSTAYLVNDVGQRLVLVNFFETSDFATAVLAPAFHASKQGSRRLVGARYADDVAQITESRVAPDGLDTFVYGSIDGHPLATALGDITGDGADEVVMLSSAPDGGLTISMLSGLDLFSEVLVLGSFRVAPGPFVAPALGVADFDRDGIDDIAVIGQGSATVPPRVRVYRMGVRGP